MQARATLGGNQLATGVLRMFIAAVLIALVVGGAGGYVVRALTYSASINVVPESHRPFVIEQPPFTTPSAAPEVFPNPPSGVPGYY